MENVINHALNQYTQFHSKIKTFRAFSGSHVESADLTGLTSQPQPLLSSSTVLTLS